LAFARLAIMNNLTFLLSYVQSCMGGKFPAADCGAVWHLIVIAVLLVAAISTLAVLRWRGRGQASAA